MSNERSHEKTCVICFDVAGIRFRSEPVPLSEVPQKLSALYDDGISSVVVEKEN